MTANVGKHTVTLDSSMTAFPQPTYKHKNGDLPHLQMLINVKQRKDERHCT